jgi:3-hydroxyacyl-CoA dehydrogenase
MFSYLISILCFVVFTTARLCLDLRVASKGRVTIARPFDQARPQSQDSDIGTHRRSLVKGQIQSDKHDLSEADLVSLQNAVHKEDVKYRAASDADYTISPRASMATKTSYISYRHARLTISNHAGIDVGPP